MGDLNTCILRSKMCLREAAPALAVLAGSSAKTRGHHAPPHDYYTFRYKRVAVCAYVQCNSANKRGRSPDASITRAADISSGRTDVLHHLLWERGGGLQRVLSQ